MRQTRRAYLAASGTVLGGVAGCLGGGSGGPSEPDSQTTAGANGCTLQQTEKVEELPTPTLGDDNAGVVMKVWEDFSCPHCATFTLEVLPKLRSEYVESGEVRYEHYDFPIPIDEKWSWAAASAARGVQDATDENTFFEYAHKLFENQGSYSMSLVTQLANDVGAPGCEIQADAVYLTYEPVLQATRQAGVDMGLEGTPAVYVNGESVKPSYEAVSAAVDAHL